MGRQSTTPSETPTTGGGRSRPFSWLAPFRPGVVVALSVITVVGGAGIVTLDRDRIITGFVVGGVVLTINVVVVTIRSWHRGNTQVDAAYTPAEDVVRLRSPRTGRETAKR